MKKKFPIWLVCVLFVAGTLLLNLRYWTPIKEESCERLTLTLEDATKSGGAIVLDFGKTDDFKLPYSSSFAPLLEEDAWGQEYSIVAQYKPMRRNRDYYDVYALSAADGTVYLTIEQSEAIRQGMLPKRLALTLGLDALACGLIVLRMRADRRKAANNTEEGSP